MKVNFGREEERRLSNGLLQYSYASPGLHGFCLCLYARAGTLYEKNEESGISHFVEHIVFRNINRIYEGKLYDMLDRAGLSFTAATYKEMMQFCMTGARENFRLAVDILTKLLEPLSPKLCGEEFEMERDRIRAEIREYDEKSSLEYMVKKEVWADTPLENMITGTLGSVSKISLKKCERARKTIFAADNAFLYVTGSFSCEDLSYLAQKAGQYPLLPHANRDNSAGLPVHFGKRNAPVLLKDSSYYMVELCFDLVAASSQKPERSLFYDLMFSGENCRFFRELSERLGYIYSYDAKLEEYGHACNLSVSYEVSLKHLYDSLSAAVELFQKMKQDASGLECAKVYYTGNACLLLDNAEELNWTMAYENHILEERKDTLEQRCRRYENVTEEHICRLAQQTFRRDCLVLGIKGRKKKIDVERINQMIGQIT